MTMTLDDVRANLDARYTVAGYRGVAWYVHAIETSPDDDTEWSGIENETGNVSMIMVGDDREFSTDPADLTMIDDDAYCSECGQVGCHGDMRTWNE